ncbi:hypothetical protein IGJ00_001874 [Enterococcus sp. AZ062]
MTFSATLAMFRLLFLIIALTVLALAFARPNPSTIQPASITPATKPVAFHQFFPTPRNLWLKPVNVR